MMRQVFQTVLCISLLGLWGLPLHAADDHDHDHADQPYTGQLPAGHPPTPGHPTAMQPAVKGTLVIKAVQGTPDGADLAGATVTVDWYGHDKTRRQQTLTLDDRAMAVIENLTITGPVQPVVKIKHAGINYQGVGQPLTPDQPDQMVRLTVYETTRQTPSWDIALRHLFVNRDEQGLRVTEVLKIANPANRTWLGALDSDICRACLKDHDHPADKSGCAAEGPGQKRTTIVIPLPEKATDVKLGTGFSSCCAMAMENRIITADPLTPGTTEFRFSYLIPLDHDQGRLDVVAPAPVQHMMMLVPADNSTVTVQGLKADKTVTTQKGDIRVYQSGKIAKGQKISLEIAFPAGSSPDTAKQAGGAPLGVKVIAGTGGGVLVLAALLVLFLKPNRDRTEASQKA